jgi:hypothetical protein
LAMPFGDCPTSNRCENWLATTRAISGVIPKKPSELH